MNIRSITIHHLLYISCIILVGFGCTNENATMQNQLNQMQLDLTKRVERLSAIETKLGDIDLVEKGDFIHEVYFTFKKDMSEKDLENFIEILNELKTIKEAKGTQIGIPKATGDQRIRSDYNMVLHMSFNNMEDYKTYQNHETHLSVKKRIGSLLAGPPFVYDYEVF